MNYESAYWIKYDGWLAVSVSEPLFPQIYVIKERGGNLSSFLY